MLEVYRFTSSVEAVDASPYVQGYQCLEKLHDSPKTRVYRGVRNADQENVVIKTIKNSQPTETELARLRSQYHLIRNIDHPGIIQLHALEVQPHLCALIMEDFGAMSLQQYLERYPTSVLSLDEFYRIALQIVEALIEIHHHRIIHKDIKPQNILIHPPTGVVKLSDFCIASQLPREILGLRSPTTLEGTSAYMSPEQTGQMNRGVDYRTDLYSLGVVFFQLLAGQLPFYARRLRNWIHCHVTKRPPILHGLNPDVPPMLSAIVDKLLSKQAEERYQSAAGLKHDLEKCQRRATNLDFALGKHEHYEQFVIPEQLYGRQHEVSTLLTAFERVAEQQKAMVLFTGPSGIGKTRAVHEVRKSIVQKQGYFIEGKFKQQQRVALSAFTTAFRCLVEQILTEDEAAQQQWRERLLTAIGANGQLLIDFIPELEPLIGPQPAVPGVGGAAAQTRFNHALQQFIRTFTQSDHPLVIFIDDLQWADSASLALFQHLMTDDKVESLLLIGAYREAEVLTTDPLATTLDSLEKTNVPFQHLPLGPLDLSALNTWTAEALRCHPSQALPLAQFIFRHTQGHPFFSTQFLQALFQEGLIYAAGSTWRYDLSQAASLTLPQDAVDFIIQRIKTLPPMTQTVLHLAACLGSRFDLKTLALAFEGSEAGTASHLNQALHEGLILPLSEAYKLYIDADEEWSLPFRSSLQYQFLHDSVQRAAYCLVPASEQAATHLRVGRLLLKHRQSESIPLPEIVAQLNQGAVLMSSTSERLQLVRSNLAAGKAAKAAVDPSSALQYFRSGIELLPQQCWQEHYRLTLKIHTEAVEAAYLCAQYDEMEQLAIAVLNQATTDLDCLKVRETQILAYSAQNQPSAALQVALDFLECLGVSFPVQPKKLDVEVTLQETAALVGTVGIENLAALPRMKDPAQLAKLLILSRAWPMAYIAGSPLMPMLVLELVKLTVQGGRSPFTAFIYVAYGLVLCGADELETGYRFGELALDLQCREGSPEAEPIVVGLANLFVRHFRDPLWSTLAPLQQMYQTALSVGNVEYVAYAAHHYGEHAFFAGQELNQLLSEVATYGDAISDHHQLTVLCYNDMLQQMILNLLGHNQTPWLLEGTAYSQKVRRPHHQDAQDILALFYVDFKTMILAYLFDQREQAVECAARAEQYVDRMAGMIDVPLFCFYDALIQLARYPVVSEIEQAPLLRKVTEHCNRLEQWASHAPHNYQHRVTLIAAEQYRVQQSSVQAVDYIERAITEAEESGYLLDIALANELAARFYDEWGKEKLADPYLKTAHQTYQRWGAQAKVRHLEQTYPQLFATTSSTCNVSTVACSVSTVKATLEQESLSATGLQNLRQAAESLSQQQSLKALLSSLLQSAMKQTGAETGQILLPQATGWIAEVCLPKEQPPSLPQIPEAILQYVERTQTGLVLDQVSTSIFATDPYVIQQQPQSLLCLPILQQATLIGALYLEHRKVQFSEAGHLEALKLLLIHTAALMENLQLRQSYQRYDQQIEQSQAEQHQLHDQLLYNVHHDALTGLLNRAWLMDRLTQMARRKPSCDRKSLLLVDIDNFSAVNHQYGYQIGDQLLAAVAEQLKTCLRETDNVVRWNGDQFIILLENQKWADEPVGLAKRLGTLLTSPLETIQPQLSVTVTIGILCNLSSYRQVDEMLKDLWTALAQAKAESACHYSVFAPMQANGNTASSRVG